MELDTAQRQGEVDSFNLDGLFDSQPDLRSPETRVIKLHDSRVPPEEYLKERPWHRTAAYLAARGFTQKAVAEACGKSEAAVSLLAKQPWFQTNIATIIADLGIADSAMEMLKAASTRAAQSLIYLVDNAKSEVVKMNASRDVLDRVLGKADLKIIHSNDHVPLDPSEELRQIKLEIARLEEASNV